MGKGFIITKDGQEIVLNISQIEHIFNETVQFAGGLNIGPYDTQTINEIKVAVEAYSPGVSPEVIEELERQISDLNAQIEVLDAQIGSLNEQISSLETENTALIAQRDTLIAQKEQLEEQVAALTAEVELAYQRGYEDGYNAGGGDWHSSNPLCFTSEQANSTIGVANNRLVSPEISYNGTDWEEYRGGVRLANIGDKVYIRSKLVIYNVDNNNAVKNMVAFTMSGKIAASGNPESLHEWTKGELYPYCYMYMFESCTSLTTAPELPSTNLAPSCYRQMFSNCTSLAQAPELPATTLTQRCYQNMFESCTSLTTAPELPATTLTEYCYYHMFSNCTSLAQAPELPATTLGNTYCYGSMFSNCTSLAQAPELPATTLAPQCYYNMFYGCTSLTQAPILPATTLANGCYNGMFYNCTSLTTASELPVTTLAYGCYRDMFYGCKALTAAPELPATTLASQCYYSMFNGCSSLTTAPELPATTLAQYCYYTMFQNCNNLNYIKVGATSWSTSNTSNWVSGVSATGTFVKPEATSIPAGTSGIPSGWTVKGPEPEDYKGLCFTAVNANSTIAQNIGKDGCTYSTSTDGINWESYTLGTVITLTNAGDKVYWKGNGINNTTINPVFVMTGVINASGSIMSLIDEVGESTDMTGNAFNRMFLNCKSLYKAPKLPATTLSPSCYQYMFANCTGLSTAPELPAKEVSHYEYEYMFQSCYNIQYIKVGATSWNTSDTDSWLYGSAGTGTFVKPKDTVIPTGTSGIPSGWTVRDSDLTGDNVLNEDSKYLIRKYPFSNNRFIYDFGPISSGAELEVLYDGTVIGVERIVGNTYTVHNAEWTGGLIDDNANFNYSFGNSVVMQYQRVGREEMWVEI